MLRSAGALAVALTSLSSSAATEPCPETTLSCLRVESSVTPVAFISCQTGEPYYGSGSANADHPAGQFEASSSWEPDVLLDARDRFAIEGLSPGGIPVNVVLEVTGQACGGDVSHGWATLDVGSATEVTHFYGNLPWEPCQPPSIRTLVLPFTAQNAVEFEVRVRLEARPLPGGHSDVSARLRFEGLPPGARVRSCKGYAVDIPVDAKPVSWGRMKQTYR